MSSEDPEDSYSSDSEGEYGVESDTGEEENQEDVNEDTVDLSQLPLCERLRLADQARNKLAFDSVNVSAKRKRKSKSLLSDNEMAKVSHKNAPAVMPSNKPVKRLRVDASATTREFRDPRFSSVSGQLDQEKFLQAYNFLDEHQAAEVDRLGRAMKKTKSVARKESLRQEYLVNQQQLTERRRSQAVKGRLQELKREEREKVSRGKGAYHLKRSERKAIAVEERFNELKKSGRLHKVMAKKRRKAAGRDAQHMPVRRPSHQ